MDSKHVLAKNMRTHRKELRWTRETLAKKAGMSIRGVGKIERCELSCSLDTVDKIAAALGLPTSVLLRDYGNIYEPEVQ